jgi:hypothetical protein
MYMGYKCDHVHVHSFSLLFIYSVTLILHVHVHSFSLLFIYSVTLIPHVHVHSFSLLFIYSVLINNKLKECTCTWGISVTL